MAGGQQDKDEPREDLRAATLLLHQCALRVQTEGVWGSLCWFTKTHQFPLLLLSHNKDLYRDTLHHNNL